MNLTPEQIERKLSATPKENMFGRLWRLGALLNAADFPERDEAIEILFGAMSWEPLIESRNPPNVKMTGRQQPAAEPPPAVVDPGRLLG